MAKKTVATLQEGKTDGESQATVLNIRESLQQLSRELDISL